MTPSNLKDFIPSRKLGNGHWISRRRRPGLLDAPALTHEGTHYYSLEQIKEMHRRIAIGQDRWMVQNHSRGQPSIAAIGEAYRAAAAAGRG